MKQASNPIFRESPQEVSDPDQSTRPRKAGKRRGIQKPELKMTSMIDVVFLLLIFFVMTANFTIDEGTLLATMPGNMGDHTLEHPTMVELTSADDGMTYSMRVDGVAVDGASELSAYMTRRVQMGQLAPGDLVKIKPQGEVRWQHVLNVYNACVNAELEQVSFAR